VVITNKKVGVQLARKKLANIKSIPYLCREYYQLISNLKFIYVFMKSMRITVVLRTLLFASVGFIMLACEKEEEAEEVTEPIAVSPYFNERLLISHRGNPECPENTYTAVDAADKAGFKAVECDITMTADGVFVLHHDVTIDRCSNGTGRIDEMTYDELLSYDFGSWKGEQFEGERLARLSDILDYCKSMGVILELDLADETRFSRNWIPALYELVKEKGMLGQTMFTATQDELERFLSVRRNIIVSISGVYDMAAARRAVALKDKVTLCNFSVPHHKLTSEICDFAHESGIKVKAWTVKTQMEMDKCVRRGADYIITELPMK
jgi:glycerophosphoryl diester phosphodiesterase